MFQAWQADVLVRYTTGELLVWEEGSVEFIFIPGSAYQKFQAWQAGVLIRYTTRELF